MANSKTEDGSNQVSEMDELMEIESLMEFVEPDIPEKWKGIDISDDQEIGLLSTCLGSETEDLKGCLLKV